MATDMFGAQNTQISSIARASEAVFTMDGTPMPALNVSVGYTENVQLQPLPNAYTIAIADQPSGIINIGAVLSSDLNNFLDTHGDVNSLASGDPVEIVMGSGATSVGDSAMSVEPGATITCRNTKIVEMGISTSIKGVMVKTNVKMLTLNVDKPTLGDVTPTSP